MAQRFERTFTIDAPRPTLWELLAHTDRLNRELGLPPMSVSYAPSELGGSEATVTSIGGPIKLTFDERPFDWVRPAFYTEYRVFPRGPFKVVEGGVRIVDEGERSIVTVWTHITPRGIAGAIATRPFASHMLRTFEQVCRGFDKYLKSQSANPYPKHAGTTKADAARLAVASTRAITAGARSEHVHKLVDHIESATPEETVDMRPFVLANRWGFGRIEFLHSCLIAASREVGLLNLRWRVLCPSCQGNRAILTSMRDITLNQHCEACNIRYDAGFDTNVEALFRVAPSIRPVNVQTFCIGGPGLTPHIAAQVCLGPNESKRIEWQGDCGAYRLSSLNAGSIHQISIDAAGSPDLHIHVEGREGQTQLFVSGVSLAPNGSIKFENRTNHRITLKLEEKDGRNDAATAQVVSSLQTFRDLFSSEALSPGAEIAVEHVCILFSDLKGSTELYQRQGDAPSYGTVRDHFALMQKIIGQHEGAVVKTIGDAVMGVFSDPAHALQAAIDIQQAAEDSGAGQLPVKLGLHFGPAIAVNANGILDYFGQTVNLAARVQRESLGGDIVLTQSMADDPGVKKLLQSKHTENLITRLRGLAQPVPLVRILPPSG